jgi:hypothetical protein
VEAVMAEERRVAQLTREVKAQLDAMVVGIELTVISIIQGMVLGVLVSNAVDPVLNRKLEYWPYIFVGLLTILIFWTGSLIHTLSFIGWPLEFGHTFVYFGATVVEGIALTQLTNPGNWFGVLTVYAAINWFLYWYDLRVVYRHTGDFRTSAERKLFDDICRDQLLNIRLLMPAAVGFHLFAWYAVHTWPERLITERWHVGLGLYSVVIGLWYLRQLVGLFARRQPWIIARYIQERRESFEGEPLETA